jgi:hypothetical protein
MLAAAALSLACTVLAAQDFPLRITVLHVDATDAGQQDVPIDCNMQTYSAYCNSSKSNATANVMAVEDSHGNRFSMTCGNLSQWLAAGCQVLPAGGTYNARVADNKVTVQYMTTKGRLRTVTYQLVPGSEAIAPPGEAVALAADPPAAAAVPSGMVRCSFTSTPAGAEILVDGRYAGSTPSALPLAPGDHAITVRMQGYSDWQRDLTVAQGSDLTIHSVLQKQ